MQATPSTAPGSNPLLTLLDFVASPILLFNAEGQVVFSNQAAKQMSCRPALLLGSDPNVRGLVRDIATGKTVLHLDMRVDALSDNGVARLQCRCTPRPIAGLVAMAVAEVAPEADDTAEPDTPVAAQRLSLQQIMELIKGDLAPPIQQVLAQPLPLEQPALAESVRHLNERLERLSDLVNVFGEDVLIGDERMLAPALVREIAQELAPLAQSKRVSFVIEGDREDLPPVYGSRRLMHRALHECLHNAVQHAREGVQTSESVAVGISFRAAGQHLLVNIHNIGVLSAAALTHHAAAIFRPATDKSGKAAAEPDRLRIGLPLTQRILQLHGGRLRIEQDASNELDVMLELPTGAPLRNTQQLDLLQAQIYAEDLSKLMARTRQRRSP
jgi:nitrogen-specific signal transduction histidine kinase